MYLEDLLFIGCVFARHTDCIGLTLTDPLSSGGNGRLSEDYISWQVLVPNASETTQTVRETRGGREDSQGNLWQRPKNCSLVSCSRPPSVDRGRQQRCHIRPWTAVHIVNVSIEVINLYDVTWQYSCWLPMF